MKKMFWKKESGPHWLGGELCKRIGMSTAYYLFEKKNGPIIATVWQEEQSVGWRCYLNEIGTRKLIVDSFFWAATPAEGKKRLEQMLEPDVLSEAINQVKPRLAESNQKRL